MLYSMIDIQTDQKKSHQKHLNHLSVQEKEVNHKKKKKRDPTFIKDSLIPLRGLCIQRRAAEALKMEDQYQIVSSCEQ